MGKNGAVSREKRRFPAELAYCVGLPVIACSAALMAKADLGVSMVVAPAYLLSLKFSFLSYGMAEYCFQALLLLGMCLVLRRFRVTWLLSFATAVIYGGMLDFFLWILSGFTPGSLLVRILLCGGGMAACSFGVAMIFHTYLPPEVYELLAMQISRRYQWQVSRFKLAYDLSSCALAIVMSFCFFGFGVFEGVKWGTVVCAMVNGPLIGVFNRFLEKRLTFYDRFSIARSFR